MPSITTFDPAQLTALNFTSVSCSCCDGMLIVRLICTPHDQDKLRAIHDMLARSTDVVLCTSLTFTGLDEMRITYALHVPDKFEYAMGKRVPISTYVLEILQAVDAAMRLSRG